MSGNDSQKTETKNVICFEKKAEQLTQQRSLKAEQLTQQRFLTNFFKTESARPPVFNRLANFNVARSKKNPEKSKNQKMVHHNHKRLWTPIERRNIYEYGAIYCARFGFERFKKMGENHLFFIFDLTNYFNLTIFIFFIFFQNPFLYFIFFQSSNAGMFVRCNLMTRIYGSPDRAIQNRFRERIKIADESSSTPLVISWPAILL